ncbi:MAG: hypothetical protein DRH23_13940 [Deltaproteobacteria bacterium]|nr:MAG: hypothetical protein DRH23_13940 [Deltaproteobacteria bacterium]
MQRSLRRVMPDPVLEALECMVTDDVCDPITGECIEQMCVGSIANSKALSASALSTKGGGGSTIPCPDGGSVNVDTSSGQASLINCSARGIVINATLALFVEPTGPSSYQANFNGILMVSGTFTGTIEVVQALIQWTDPATDANTYWEVTVLLDGQPDI